jgi:hypothetical protein
MGEAGDVGRLQAKLAGNTDAASLGGRSDAQRAGSDK